MMTYILGLLVVVAIAIGQILFKLAATSWQRTGSVFATHTAVILFSALALYGITTLAWIWLLQKIELGRIYPLMALAFVLVPIGSHFIFGERFSTQYFAGVTLIMLGIVVVVRS
jgi:drug/metabolite transporter (DMT)-like permease